MSPLVKVIVTGSECTGKTTLAGELAAHYGTSCSQEFARRYLERQARALTAADVEPIARGQIRAEDAAIARAHRLVILDTDLVSTVVYARHYYGSCPAWIEAEARRRLGDLYLLLHPDVAWVADGLQRDRPDLREHVHDAFRATLVGWAAAVCDVQGTWDERRATALAAIQRYLAEPRDSRDLNRG